MKSKGQAYFSFIARNPPSLLIAGGILLYILGEHGTATFLIFLGVILQILWLARRF